MKKKNSIVDSMKIGCGFLIILKITFAIIYYGLMIAIKSQ